jgi:ribose transport system ATP-binding protein
MENDNVILRTEGLRKSYPGTVALADVSLEFRVGEVHALVGENGAGKSTLIKALAGALSPDSGRIVVGGESHRALDSAQSLALGISVIYQEFMLVPGLSVAENIFLGRSPDGRLGAFSPGATRKAAKKLLDGLGMRLDPDAKVQDLSTSYQQLVEIAKAVSRDCKLLIMDEPTAPLAEDEVRLLYGIIASLKGRGVTIIYVSHRLEEIFAVSDRVSVLRDGELVATLRTADTDAGELIGLMVGRKLADVFPPRDHVPDPDRIALELKGLSNGGFLHDVNLRLRKGEILGLGGLMGSGRTETARAICGIDPVASGEIFVKGRQATIRDPRQAIALGIGYIPEDRKTLGLLLDMDINDNITMPAIRRLSRRLVISRKDQRKVSAEYVSRLRIKTPTIDKKARELSGGNQQKVVLAKWLATTCDLLIFDEPTRGIDVGAKFEIYGLMVELARSGKSILMISSDMNELLGMSDRIAVMHEGTVRAVIDKRDATQDLVLKIASGL